MKNTAGSFQVTSWDESPFNENDDGSKQSHAKITQVYTGGIVGSSELQYLMSYQSQSKARFVGFETVNGSVNGVHGSFVLQHDGKFEDGVAHSDFRVVTKSGRGDLIDIAGHGSFTSSEDGKSSYVANFTA